jgi:thiamine-phosphate diphosphorylase
MITDRLRLRREAPADLPAPRHDQLVRRIAAAARAGIHLVQVRERDLEGGPLLALVAACVDAVRRTSTRIIVNERFDVALASGAHGVHLRSDSMQGSRVRPLAPAGFLVGRSVHSREEAIRAEAEGGLDYLLFGPVFGTLSKPGAAGAGVEPLSAVVQAVRLPVLAVGGATADTAAALARAGAAGFAAIGLFSAGRDEDLGTAIAASCDRFDTPYLVS